MGSAENQRMFTNFLSQKKREKCHDFSQIFSQKMARNLMLRAIRFFMHYFLVFAVAFLFPFARLF